MVYEYKLIIDNVIVRKVENFFRSNIIAEIIKDLNRVNNKTERISFNVLKYHKRYNNNISIGGKEK